MTLTDKLKNEVLAAITESGAVSSESLKARQVINGNLNSVVNRSSGSTRFNSNVKDKFSLILSKPSILQYHNPLEIRCLLCGKVISFPCFYYKVAFTINVFHYFVCFNSDGKKVNTDCLKRR